MTPSQSDPELLVIWHSRTGASEAMAKAAAKGAKARLLKARDVRAEDLLRADGYVFCAPENLASLSGEMKEMFDQNYYAVLGKIEGRPYATVIAAGTDGQGAQRQIDRICKGWRLKRIAEPMIIGFEAQAADEILAEKRVSEDILLRCHDLGKAMDEGLQLGVF